MLDMQGGNLDDDRIVFCLLKSQKKLFHVRKFDIMLRHRGYLAGLVN